MEAVRIDRWLTAVRVYRKRTIAAGACEGGKVRLNGRAVKASAVVRVGDWVEARVGERVRELEVARVIEKRVGASLAAECFVDHTPVVEPAPQEARAAVPSRDAGAGRPTKRDRRRMEKFRGR